MQAREDYTKRIRNRLIPVWRGACNTQFSESLFGAPVNDEDDLLDPAIRHWLLSKATPPRVGAEEIEGAYQAYTRGMADFY